jgi:hypothetical protein
LEEQTATLSERVRGPIDGFYLASYALATAGGHVAYTKICTEPGPDAWSCRGLHKTFGTGSDAAAALDMAEAAALERLPLIRAVLRQRPGHWPQRIAAMARRVLGTGAAKV